MTHHHYLSWSTGTSVNDGVDKDGYLDSVFFSFTFLTTDYPVDELVKIEQGAHIF